TLASAKEIWQEKAKAYLGWNHENKALPMGQAIALAAPFADTYKTTGRLVQAILQQSEIQVGLAKKNHIICEQSPLAQAHHTTYPFVQGPMTRVSDTPGFAKAVSDGGALPLIALAVLKAEQIDSILTETEKLLRDQSWGVGLLGFIEQSLYEAQLQSVLKHKPPFALIAGGRPDQAKRLEDEGISTYIHAPTPELLRMFIAQGARKFVFEGRECGGHVGPLSSFVLWEQMIEVLLEDMPKRREDEFQLLFAGGIHDGLSATMVNVLAAPLVARGAKVGVLMGTVYLFTEEAVSQGSIVQEFQNQAIQCENTINLVTGPGHASRCVNTTFAEEFYATRRKLLQEGVDATEVSHHLDGLSLGRLRIASKGLKRDDNGDVVQVSHDEQLEEGMYMIGQVATLHHEKTTITALHEGMVQESRALIESLSSTHSPEQQQEKPIDIAIVGVSTLLPGAHDVETYWQNILNKLEVISEIPKERWDWRLYFDADRKAKEKIYMKNGGFFGEVPFDPLDFGIPPNSLGTIDPIQLLTLGVVRQALIDAGYEDGNFDREHTSVILGATGGFGDLGVQYATRTELDKVVGKPSQEVLDRLPSWNEESFAGLLLNVSAGRVANRFDLGGTNQTVDAACGSSLAALRNAVQELVNGTANVVISGGIDTIMHPFAYMCFAKTQALSPSGVSRPFDKNSDGIVISEGISVVVLKRLADAERDGDRIYGVIKGMGSSSDGRALGMTAPLAKGQMRALDRAYSQAGYTPDTVALFEAHGTGTQVGDKVESETIISTLRKYSAKPKSSVLGSVKSQIGHTKSTAGVAALIKAVLSLHHKVQSPHMNVSDPLDVIADADSPVFILNQKRPWFASSLHPRRAGVSAFGFGGTNYHAALEEYKGSLRTQPTGADVWPCELFVFRAANKTALLQSLKQLETSLAKGSQPALRELATAYAYQGSSMDTVCLSFVADDLSMLQSLVKQSIEELDGEANTLLQAPLYYADSLEKKVDKLAFMYPGQGSQYVNMGIEHAVYFDAVREAFECASEVLQDTYEKPLCDIVFPPSGYDKVTIDAQTQALTQTHVAQPALAAYSMGLTHLLNQLGIRPDAICGHSLGEYTALCATGVFDDSALYKLVEKRGRLMAKAAEGASGAMAAVMLGRKEVESWLEGEQDIVVANHNAPQQTIISGAKKAVVSVLDKMESQGVSVRLLPVSGAFHSPLLAQAKQPLSDAIVATEMNMPVIDVYANQSGEPYPDDVEAIQAQLSEHLLGSVEFVSQIERMYEAGVRTFVEVGAKNILSNLVGKILQAKPHCCIALDKCNGSLQGLLQSLAELAAVAPNLQVRALFSQRNIQVKKPNQVLSQAIPKPLGKTSYWVSGDKVRHHSEPKGSNGRVPMLTLETQRPIGQPEQTIPQVSSNQPLNDVLLSYQKTMREFLALQEKIVTDFMQGGVTPNVGAALPSITEPEYVNTQEPIAAGVKQALQPESSSGVLQPAMPDLLSLLVSIVAERTGYPEDMLDPDQDMEAELGIDSIKRVEIMGTLQSRLPEDIVALLQNHMDSISRTKSLREMVAQIENLTTSQVESEKEVEQRLNIQVGSQTNITLQHLPRFTLKAVPLAVPKATAHFSDVCILITPDKLKIVHKVVKQLKDKGVDSVVVPEAMLADVEALEAWVAQQLKNNKSIMGLIHLAGLIDHVEKSIDACVDTSKMCQKAFFSILKPLLQNKSQGENKALTYRLLAASLLGSYDVEAQVYPPITSAGLSAMLKTVRHEYPDVHARSVDFDAGVSPKKMAAFIVDEFLDEDSCYVEVSYQQDKRMTIVPELNNLKESGEIPIEPKDWVVLVTGGAKGITAEILQDLAPFHPQLVLVGRTAWSRDDVDTMPQAKSASEIRSVLIAQAQDRGERMSPKDIENQVKSVISTRDMRKNIDGLEKLGAKVDYLSCDVSDVESFSSLIDNVYSQYGRIDAVIHAAGLIEDQLLVNKTADSFNRVFDTKIMSAWTLAEHIRFEDLKLLVFFSSVSGRFGNLGQIDYAAANEVLNQLAVQLKQDWPHVHIKSINWGPWDAGTGMVTEAAEQQMADMGIGMISPELGRLFFQREAFSAATDDVVVVASSLGDKAVQHGVLH
ncbi:MAG: SDR family NAD(P)-dependent oxidoreductase, partial [Flavobacteriales bacterium]|nr:SDR family NAD(P)-dependent oxidoreductase [Flavobacteriales bacterium]